MAEFDIVTLVAGLTGLLLVAGAVRVASDRLRIPYTVALVLVGVVLGEAARRTVPNFDGFAELPMAADIILFVLIPTLVFEAAFHTNGRLLRQNLWPVLTLAVPGALLSSFLIAMIVWLVSPLSFPECLLLGAILSSTDPVAVVALFRKIGAPARLTMLVEGESLLNDATSIVLARIMLGVIAAGTYGASTFGDGITEFAAVFFGGAIVGGLAALALGWLISKVHDDSFTVTLLTAILAYATFVVAERGFHLSGVVAVVVAGLVLTDWGRTKMTPADEEQVEHFWHFAGNTANAMLFLLVGFSVEIPHLVANLDLFAWVVLALLLSRAFVVFALAPLMGRLPNTRPISIAYQTVLFWGGLRGGIAIAIVLGLTQYDFGQTFVALVMGSVLFTLVVQGMSMEPLVRWLGLDKPTLADRVSRSESQLSALRVAAGRVPELQEGGLFSARIADGLNRQLQDSMRAVQNELEELRRTELDPDQERRLLLARCFTSEQAYFHNLFRKGHLSETTYRDLAAGVIAELDAVRDNVALPPRTSHSRMRRRHRLLLQRVVGLFAHGMADRLRRNSIASDYEHAWGAFQAASHILHDVQQLALAHSTPADIVTEVRGMYAGWSAEAQIELDSTATQFPEFVNAMQERLAQRLVTLAQAEAITEKAEAGAVPPGIADELVRALHLEQRELRGGVVEPLQIKPEEMLATVPLLAEIPAQDIVPLLVSRSVPAGETIVSQGARGSSLFLIARGVVRVVTVDPSGFEHNLASLVAGDFFGEMALLTGEPRNATCRAATPCALYELRRTDFQKLLARMPAVRARLEATQAVRRQQFDEARIRPVA